MKKRIFSLLKVKKQIEPNDLEDLNFLNAKLFPIDEAKTKFKYYFEKINNAILSKGVNNIAITGSYGSGKTTLLKNFQNVYKKREYLNISLATFKEEIVNNDETNNKNNKPENKLERLIELSILQQILYKVEQSTIPNSNLKRINNIKSGAIFWITSLSLIWLFSFTVLIKFKNFYKLNPYSWNIDDSFDWFVFLVFLIFISGIGYLIQKAIRLLNGTKISKLKFLENELELGKDINKSILNEHLDEIIYFFQNTEYDVVIFEDIDRFENTEIFTKLREINLILNNSKLINRKLGKIVFIYAVRDDKFKNQERTKFFDYIVPIIPFISPSNSNEQLQILIKKEGLSNVFSNDFIRDVITFIDEIDMRLLTNIFNEFLVYKSKVLPNDDNKDRNNSLLALIIYKNTQPKDFAELSQRKGKMYNIINKKKEYTDTILKEIDIDIKKTTEQIDELENEIINKIDELNSIYINAIHKKFTNIAYLDIDNLKVTFDELQDKETFEKFKQSKSIGYYSYTRYGNHHTLMEQSLRRSQISFSEIEDIVNENLSYDQRTSFIKNNLKNKTNELKAQLEKQEFKKNEVESWDLSRIYNELNIKPSDNNFINYKLINYLLLNGHINENYHHYISLFHAENLSKEDFDFEKMVKSGEKSNFNFQLNKVENLSNNISKKYFEREVVLNFDLLNHLLNNQKNNQEKIKSLFSQLSNEKTRVISFIDAYIDFEEIKTNTYDKKGNPIERNNISHFIKLLSKYWSRFWDFIEYETNYSDEKKRKYLKYIILYANKEDFKKLDSDGNLSFYTEMQENFLKLFKKRDFLKVQSFISVLNIKFNGLHFPNIEQGDLFDFIYLNNHYDITINNISIVLKVKNKKDSLKNTKNKLSKIFYSNNFGFILNSECEKLIEYLNGNINNYIENVYLKIKDENLEKEDILLNNIYNNEDLKDNLKIDVIKKTSTKINSLNEIDKKEIKSNLVKYNKTQASWTNVYFYISDYDNIFIDERLINFYNTESNYNKLSTLELSSTGKELDDFYKNIRYSILKCNELKIDAYKSLIKSISKVYADLSFEEISSDKVQALIDNSKLTFSIENYNRLEQYFPNKHILFVLQNFKKFILLISEIHFNDADLLLLLKSNKLNEVQIIELIKVVEEKFITDNKESSKIICSHLSKSNYISLSTDLLFSLISNGENLVDKLNLLLIQIPYLEKEVTIKLLEFLPEPYSKLSISKKRPLFKNINMNIELLDKLESKKIIYPFKSIKGKKIRAIVK